MQFGISTQVYRGQPLTVDLLESIRKAGYEQFELFCNRPHLDFHNRKLMRAIGRWFQENSLPPPSLHLPFIENHGPNRKVWISILEPEHRHRAAGLDEIKRSLEFAEHVGLAYVVMHLGNPQDKFTPLAFEYAYAAIAQIRAFAGVEVMIENIPNEISTLDRIEEFKSVSQSTHLGICYDTGHGHLQGISSGFENIRTTHVHDNHGDTDEHLWPFEGTLDWPALVEKLILANYKGPLVFEARNADLSKGGDAQSRLQDLWDEAANSMDEYRLKYSLKTSPSEEREEKKRRL